MALFLKKNRRNPKAWGERWLRVPSPTANAHRKQRVTALLETAVENIASGRQHPQPGMKCSWCQFKNECLARLPGMTVADIQQKDAA
jgi:hypothetical protein